MLNIRTIKLSHAKDDLCLWNVDLLTHIAHFLHKKPSLQSGGDSSNASAKGHCAQIDPMHKLKQYINCPTYN